MKRITPNIAKEDRFLKKFCRFVPKHISNRVLVDFMDLLRFFSAHKHYKEHYMENKKNLEFSPGFLEDQNHYLGFYGKEPVSYCSCEVIALYNALYDANHPIPLYDLLSIFEKNGILFQGSFGTSIKSIDSYLRKNAPFLETSFITKNELILQALKTCDGMILMFYNNKSDLSDMIHTIYIRSILEDNHRSYTAFNVSCDGKSCGPFDSFPKLLHAISIETIGPIAGIAISLK